MDRSVANRIVPAAIFLVFMDLAFSVTFPSTPLRIIALFFLPLAILLTVMVIWPERKGELWPYKGRRYARGVQSQVWWSVIVTLATFVNGLNWVYNYEFTPGFITVHHYLPIPTVVYVYTIPPLTVVMGIGFFLQLWRYVRMLPPKPKAGQSS
ncbi:MAG: hypothetical protein JRM72_01465 [Nitrososphaerota archaeon]|nr:hypothetical protein [Nitrososphaerota archaeon]